MSKDYWLQRMEEEMLGKQLMDANLLGAYRRLYDYHFAKIETEILAYYQRYTSQQGISLAEAKRRVSKMDVKAFETKAKRYVQDRDFSPKANKELKLYNLTMKVNRLELLQYHLDLEMLALTEGEYKLTHKFLEREYIEELTRQAGILGQSLPEPETLKRFAETTINANFHGAKWSERIWERQEALREIVSNGVYNAMVRGTNATELVSGLKREFGVSTKEAHRLAVTEMARVQTEAQRKAYEDADYEEYIYLAEPTACPQCATLHGEIYKVKEMNSGDNAPPMHPHCHCSTAPHESREKLDQMFESLELESAREDEVVPILNSPVDTVFNLAKKLEQAITQDMISISKTVGSEMVGLDFRLKSKTSLDLKMSKEPNVKIRDAIRYTSQSDQEVLVKHYFEFLENLEEKGYILSEVKNYWLKEDNPYNGVNTNVFSPGGYEFEIQFHTPESFSLKNGQLHELYEKARLINDEESPEFIELMDEMFRLSNQLRKPKGVEEVE